MRIVTTTTYYVTDDEIREAIEKTKDGVKSFDWKYIIILREAARKYLEDKENPKSSFEESISNGWIYG